MIKKIINLKKERNIQRKEVVQEAIRETLSKEGIVISHATTVREICNSFGYNRSVEIPFLNKKRN